MIFGDLVCCVQFVVLLHSCTGAASALVGDLDPPPAPLPANRTADRGLIVAFAQVRQPSGAGNRNRTAAGRYTESLPAELNEYCRTSQDCRQHAHVCDARTQSCSCADGYRPDEANRVCLGAVGRRCLYDSHCVTNAYCKGQMICTCKREYGFLTDDNWSCQASSAPGSPRVAYEGQRFLTVLLVAGVALLSIHHQQTAQT